MAPPLLASFFHEQDTHHVTTEPGPHLPPSGSVGWNALGLGLVLIDATSSQGTARGCVKGRGRGSGSGGSSSRGNAIGLSIVSSAAWEYEQNGLAVYNGPDTEAVDDPMTLDMEIQMTTQEALEFAQMFGPLPAGGHGSTGHQGSGRGRPSGRGAWQLGRAEEDELITENDTSVA